MYTSDAFPTANKLAQHLLAGNEELVTDLQSYCEVLIGGLDRPEG